ncbi:MAG: hypothetical protein K2K23_05410, partial [Muribaculaceae bacterium]|nr:hypothetical protein [Muribaculaceae bacterium]
MDQLKENDLPKGKGKHGASVMYIVMVGVFFALLTVVFVGFPRSRYSELDKRDLAELPDFTDVETIKKDPAKFTSDVSTWFSDTEPYRDELMTMSMKIRDAMKADFRSEEETVSFRPADTAVNTTSEEESTPKENVVEKAKEKDDADNAEALSDVTEEEDDIDDGKAKLGSSGTIIIGKGDKVRALMAFGGTAKGGGGYVDLLNT